MTSRRNTVFDLAVPLARCFCLGAALALAGCGGSSDDGSPAAGVRLNSGLVAAVWHTDLVFDATRSQLYASSLDPANLLTMSSVVAIDTATGLVKEILPPSAEGPPTATIEVFEGTLALSANARALYFVTLKGSVSRLDLATGTVDFTLTAPSGARETLKVGSVVASRKDDALAYVMLYDDVGSVDDAVAAVRNAAWLPDWVNLQSQQNLSLGDGNLGLSLDESELFPNPPLQRVGTSSSGPSLVLKRGTAAVAGSVPQPVDRGILVGTRVYDATTLDLQFEIAGASICAPLPSRVRVVCTGPTQQTGHPLFVFDLRTRTRTVEWTAGFDSGSQFVSTPPLLIRSVGVGKIAISYGSANKLATYGPSSVAFYSDAAFE